MHSFKRMTRYRKKLENQKVNSQIEGPENVPPSEMTKQTEKSNFDPAEHNSLPTNQPLSNLEFQDQTPKQAEIPAPDQGLAPDRFGEREPESFAKREMVPDVDPGKVEQLPEKGLLKFKFKRLVERSAFTLREALVLGRFGKIRDFKSIIKIMS